MKLLIICCTAFTLVASDWHPRSKEQYLKDRDECFESEKVSDHCRDEIKRHIFPDEPNCYFHCIMLKGGVWDDATGYNVDRAYEEITHAGYETTKENLNKCNTDEQKDNDSCHWANNIAKCVWQKKYIIWE